MKHIEYRSIIVIYIISILIFLYATPAFTETTIENSLLNDTSSQIQIRSDSFEVDNQEQVVIFIGDVEAVRDDIKINCQRIELFYENLSDANDPENTGSGVRVVEIIATENVILSRPNVGMAMAGKAIYYQNDEKVVLTGNPVIKQGDDFIEGHRITLFLKEGRSLVEGSEDGKATAVLFPNK
jgi:lipopolysaccharide export system protein LptA